MTVIKKLTILFILFANVSCVNNDLQNALNADKNGDTNNAIKHFDKYLNNKTNGNVIRTSNTKINTLQAKKLVKKIENTLETEEETLTAHDYRKLLSKIDKHSDWDPNDVIFSLIKSKINERLSVIQNECQSLENVLNLFLQNNEEIKAFKTYNFIKEKDKDYEVAPLTEIKIIDIFIKNNEKNFFKNLDQNKFEEASLFLRNIDEQYFRENHKNELRTKYTKILERKVTPKIESLINEKKFLNAYYINNATINNETFAQEIKDKLKENLINTDGIINLKNFLTLEGYLIISPELKPLVEKEYYETIDQITLPTTNISFILKNYQLKKELYSDLKSSLKEEISQMTIPVKIKNSKTKKLDYAIELDTYKITQNELKTKLSIVRLKPKYEHVVLQNIFSKYDNELEKISIDKLTKKIIKVVRQNVKLDTLTMLKSARYYLTKKDFKNFTTITNQLILLNQVDPFCDELKNKLLNLLSEYEAL